MEARRSCLGSYDIHPNKRWRRLGPEWQPRVDWSSGIFLKVELMLLGKICVVGSLWLSLGPPRECTLLPLPWSEASGTSLRSTGGPSSEPFSLHLPSICLHRSIPSTPFSACSQVPHPVLSVNRDPPRFPKLSSTPALSLVFWPPPILVSRH